MWKTRLGQPRRGVWKTVQNGILYETTPGHRRGRPSRFTRLHTKGERFVPFPAEGDWRVGGRRGSRMLLQGGQGTPGDATGEEVRRKLIDRAALFYEPRQDLHHNSHTSR
jgi:hypothetical protein